jgi:anhydro-N-acetylmuramic acid kinase
LEFFVKTCSARHPARAALSQAVWTPPATDSWAPTSGSMDIFALSMMVTRSMDTLERLARKPKLLVVGLMSGTSADGMDAALVEISGGADAPRIRELAYKSYPYPRGYKQYLLAQSHPDSARLDEIARLNVLVAEFAADAVAKIARQGRRSLGTIDLVGSHGQTIQHLPKEVRRFGKTIRATLQVGDPSVIAKRTGIVTVGNFRTADIAAGGSGAPLVPLFDYLTLRSKKLSRGVLNIGGIANITVLPKGSGIGQVRAFDTGPGNMVIDALMERFYRRPYDRHGAVASRGRILPGVMRALLNHPYFSLRPPKSTGREAFGEEFIRTVLLAAGRAPKEDLIATVTEFTALSVYQQYLAFAHRTTPIDELLVSGGGVHNPTLMEALAAYFGRIPVRPNESAGVSPDAKEAVCFALLARETIAGRPGNVPGATGARRQTVLGEIALPEVLELVPEEEPKERPRPAQLQEPVDGRVLFLAVLPGERDPEQSDGQDGEQSERLGDA